MEISRGDLSAVLRNNRVWLLYHENTVVTSVNFLREGALLSRAEVERRGLYQSPQPKSDKKDKRYGVWDDVFTDTVDIH